MCIFLRAKVKFQIQLNFRFEPKENNNKKSKKAEATTLTFFFLEQNLKHLNYVNIRLVSKSIIKTEIYFNYIVLAFARTVSVQFLQLR